MDTLPVVMTVEILSCFFSFSSLTPTWQHKTYDSLTWLLIYISKYSSWLVLPVATLFSFQWPLTQCVAVVRDLLTSQSQWCCLQLYLTVPGVTSLYMVLHPPSSIAVCVQCFCTQPTEKCRLQPFHRRNSGLKCQLQGLCTSILWASETRLSTHIHKRLDFILLPRFCI